MNDTTYQILAEDRERVMQIPDLMQRWEFARDQVAAWESEAGRLIESRSYCSLSDLYTLRARSLRKAFNL